MPSRAKNCSGAWQASLSLYAPVGPIFRLLVLGPEGLPIPGQADYRRRGAAFETEMSHGLHVFEGEHPNLPPA